MAGKNPVPPGPMKLPQGKTVSWDDRYGEGEMPPEAYMLLDHLLAGGRINAEIAEYLGQTEQALRQWSKHDNFKALKMLRQGIGRSLQRDAVLIVKNMANLAKGDGSLAVQAAKIWREMAAELTGKEDLSSLLDGDDDDRVALDRLVASDVTDEDLHRLLKDM
jgi:hypothetical protein